MKRIINFGLIVFLVILPLMIGCQGEPTNEPILPGGRLIGINLEPGSLTLDAGSTIKFLATGIFSGGVEFDLTPFVSWISSNTSVAFFHSDGTLVANTPGAAQINAKFADVLSQTITITVPGAPVPGPGTDVPVLTDISVTPKFASIDEEGDIQYACTGIFSDGTTQDYTFSATWRISDPTLGFITNMGKFVSVGGGGIITVSAKYGTFESNYAVLAIHEAP